MNAFDEAGVLRAQLIEAVAQLSGQTSFAERLTVAAICAEARVSRRRFSDAFADVSGCLAATVRAGYAELERSLDSAWARAGHTAACLSAWPIELAELPERRRALIRVAVVHAALGGDEALVERRRAHDHLVRRIKWCADLTPLAAQAVGATVVETLHAQLAVGVDPGPGGQPGALLGASSVHPEARPTAFEVAPSHEPDGEWTGTLRLTSMRAAILQHVDAHPGASNEDVQRMLGVAHASQVSRQLAALARHGLLTRATAGRRNAWTITPDAQQLLRLADAGRPTSGGGDGDG